MFEVRICRRLLTLKRLFGQMESPAEIKSLVSQKKKEKSSAYTSAARSSDRASAHTKVSTGGVVSQVRTLNEHGTFRKPP